MTGWISPALGTAYQMLETAKRQIGAPDDSPASEAIKRALDAIEEADILLEGSDA